MTREKILLVSDSINGPTGFAVNGYNIAWGLAKEYDVHCLGLQTMSHQKFKTKVGDEEREVTIHPNLPRSNQEWDFGFKSLPVLLEKLKPEVLLTINDIQMIQHIPQTLYKTDIRLSAMDLPSRKLVNEDTLVMQLKAEMETIREKYPLDTKWILYGPQDGEPPMPHWKNVYALADQVVSFCKYGQGIYKRYYNMDVPYIYHGVDTDAFKPMEKTMFKDNKIFVIGNMNRNQPRKHPVKTIKAFAKFAHNKSDVALWMQMDWNDRFGWPLQYFTNLYGVGNKVVQPAPVGIPRDQIIKIYNEWDLNVNTTGGEGFGLTEIEGMACAKPNIATDYTTTKEFTIEGDPSPRGVAVPYSELYWEKMDVAAVQRSSIDVEKLTDTFEMYYQNRELVKQHGENARIWTEKNCAMKNIQNQWVSLVKDVLSRQE
jgi:glycosyltransferase involved in cell wall biosynthesis